jgi:hypothetical protein
MLLYEETCLLTESEDNSLNMRTLVVAFHIIFLTICRKLVHNPRISHPMKIVVFIGSVRCIAIKTLQPNIIKDCDTFE